MRRLDVHPGHVSNQLAQSADGPGGRRPAGVHAVRRAQFSRPARLVRAYGAPAWLIAALPPLFVPRVMRVRIVSQAKGSLPSIDCAMRAGRSDARSREAAGGSRQVHKNQVSNSPKPLGTIPRDKNSLQYVGRQRLMAKIRSAKHLWSRKSRGTGTRRWPKPLSGRSRRTDTRRWPKQFWGQTRIVRRTDRVATTADLVHVPVEDTLPPTSRRQTLVLNPTKAHCSAANQPR